MKKVKKIKPTNYIFIAMKKRSGAGSHKKSNKSVRRIHKVLLKKDILIN